jgi:hypothetical protein
LEKLSVDGRIKLRYVFRECVMDVAWIHVACDRDRLWVAAIAEINLHVP